MTLLTLLLWISKFSIVISQISCHDAYECASTILSDTDNTTFTSEGGNIECYGYHSCRECDLIESTNDDTNIDCYGSFSCYNSTLITSDSGDIKCMYYVLYVGYGKLIDHDIKYNIMIII